MSINLNNNDEFEKFVRSQKSNVGSRKNYNSRTTHFYHADGSITEIDTIDDMFMLWTNPNDYTTTANDPALFKQAHPSSNEINSSSKWKNVRKLYWYRYLKDRHNKEL